ncbi:transcriptional regulator, partial [Clostridium saccharoperbutylacetonicum]|uniref:transcriptional regulator n=1 Tax=Clostridium saccharoperbutylacetonicum TaxID=36745 RepID=UPI0039E7AD49
MFDNEIMKQGERLKKIRQLILGATQEEVSEGVCTRIMISLIENNKQKLSHNLAYGIAENLNRIAKEKKIDISLITPKELMINADQQANYVFQSDILSKLHKIEIDSIEINLLERKISEAEKLIEKYSITDDKKIDFYKLSADLYYYKHSYAKSDQMCDIGLKISINSKNSFEEVSFYIYRAKNNIFTENYDKALQQLDYAEKLNNDIDNNELYEMIFYHKALAYKKQGEYDDALKYFKMLKEKFQIKNKKMLLKVKMVYANCLTEQHKFEQAKKEYVEILNRSMEIDNKDFICMTYRNLSELYFNKKDYKSAIKYIKYSLKSNPNNDYLNENLYFAAKIFQSLSEDAKEIEDYLLRSLDICEKNDNENIELIEKIIYELVLIYIKREDEKNIALMSSKAKELNKDCYLIYLKLIE